MSVVGITDNKLKINNPNTVHGLVLLAQAVVLLFGGLLLFSTGVNALLAILNSIGGTINPILLVLRGGYVFFMLLFFVGAAIRFFTGLRFLVSFYLPPAFPAAVDSKSVGVLLLQRILMAFEKPNQLLLQAASLFSERLRYLTLFTAEYVGQTVSGLKSGVVTFVLALGGSIALLHYLSQGQLHFTAGSMLLFTAWALLLGFRLVSVLFINSPHPSAQVWERRVQLTDAGNPNNLHTFILTVMDSMRVGQFQNRIYSDRQPVLDNIQDSVTGSLSGEVTMETQPVPQRREYGFVPYLLWAGALLFEVAFVLAGIYLINRLPRLAILRFPEGYLLIFDAAAVLILAIMSSSVVRSFNDTAYQLRNIFRFESTLLSVNLSGTYSASTFGLGDGRGGQLYSKRTSIQSDVCVVVRASQVVSESWGLLGPRVLIGAYNPPEFCSMMEELMNRIASYRDSGGKLVNVDLEDEALKNLSSLNEVFTGRQAMAQEAGRQNARAVARNAPRDSLPFGEMSPGSPGLGAPAGPSAPSLSPDSSRPGQHGFQAGSQDGGVQDGSGDRVGDADAKGDSSMKEAVVFCTQCARRLKSGDRFCSGCGTAVQQDG